MAPLAAIGKGSGLRFDCGRMEEDRICVTLYECALLDLEKPQQPAILGEFFAEGFDKGFQKSIHGFTSLV